MPRSGGQFTNGDLRLTSHKKFNRRWTQINADYAKPNLRGQRAIMNIHRLQVMGLSGMPSRRVDGIEIFLRHEQGETYTALAREFGFTPCRAAQLGRAGRTHLRLVHRTDEALKRIF